MKVLVTGASGFVGSSFLSHASRSSHDDYRAAVRPNSRPLAVPVETAVVEGLTESADWRRALIDCDVVVHTAARVHVMRETAKAPLAEFRNANVTGTLRLAQQSAAIGVRRFVFISTVKVNGEETMPGHPFSPDALPAPSDPYAMSKHEAEQGLLQLGRETGMEIVVIRPALVYGPGVQGNFAEMLRWLRRGIPLPFESVRNLRSLVAVENLVDLMILSLSHPAAAGQTFFVSDGDDMSTPDLLRRAAMAMGRPARLWRASPRLIDIAGRLFGYSAVVQRLCGSLQVDISKTRELLGWTPPVRVSDALRQTVNSFMHGRTT